MHFKTLYVNIGGVSARAHCRPPCVRLLLLLLLLLLLILLLLYIYNVMINLKSYGFSEKSMGQQGTRPGAGRYRVVKG